MLKRIQSSLLLSCCLMLAGCVGSIVGAVVDTTIEVAKVPFKVGGAVIDVVNGDDFTQTDSVDVSSSSQTDDISLETQGL